MMCLSPISRIGRGGARATFCCTMGIEFALNCSWGAGEEELLRGRGTTREETSVTIDVKRMDDEKYIIGKY